MTASPHQVEQWILQSNHEHPQPQPQPSRTTPRENVSGGGGGGGDSAEEYTRRFATHMLHQWTATAAATTPLTTAPSLATPHDASTPPSPLPHDSTVPAVLFQLLCQSRYPTVQFYALSTLQRWPLSTMQRVQLRQYLMHEFMTVRRSDDSVTSNNNNNNFTAPLPSSVLPPSLPPPPRFLRNKAASVLAVYIVQDAASTELWSQTIVSDLVQLSRWQPVLFLQTILYVLDDIARVSSSASARHNNSNCGDDNRSDPTTGSSLLTMQQTRRFKDFLKGYHDQNSSDTPINGPTTTNATTTTLLEYLFRSVVDILNATLSVHSTITMTTGMATATVATGQGTTTTMPSNRCELQLLAMQTVTGFFQWTSASFLGHQTVNQCLELMLYIITKIHQPHSTSTSSSLPFESLHRTAAVAKATWQAWYEWITSCHSDVVVNGHHHTTGTTTTPLPSSIQSLADPKLPVLVQLLERIHETHLLPEATAVASAHLLDASSTKIPSPSDSVDAEGMEVIIQLAIVVNSVALELLPLYEREVLLVQPSENRNRSLESLFLQSLELFFRAFAYDDIDVTSAVLPFATRLSGYMEEVGTANESKPTASSLRQHLPLVLVTLFHQMQYPTDFEYDYEDEDDAEEFVLRTELCKVFNKLVRAAPETCLQFITEAASLYIFTNSAAAASTPRIEAILRLMYHYCDALQPPPGLKAVMRNETFCSLLEALHTSNITQHPHREVVCLYYELAVRYYPLFLQKDRTGLLAGLLGAMSGMTGLQHEHSRVRSRCCYLLLRLTKSTIALLRPFVETAVMGIQALLSNANLALRPDDSLYLFETIGLLLGKTGLDTADQKRFLTAVMSPYIHSIEGILRNLPGSQQGTENQIEVLSGSIAAITHLSKGFHKPDSGICAILIEALGITLAVLEALSRSESIRNKSMVLLQRMLLCAGNDVLSMIPNFLRLLITDCTSDDILFVSQIFNQLCIKFNAEAIPAMDEALLPFLHKCQSLVLLQSKELVGEANDTNPMLVNLIPPHLQTEQMSIQKLAYVVLQHVVTYKATLLLVSDVNANQFAAVLGMASEGAIRVSDPVIRKTCLRFFRELLEQFSESSIPVVDSYRHGLVVFLSQSMIPGVLHAMVSTHSFNVKDANQVNVIAEFARLLIAIQALCHANDELYRCFVTVLSSVLVVGGDTSGRSSAAEYGEVFRHVTNVEGMQAYLIEIVQRSHAGGNNVQVAVVPSLPMPPSSAT